MERNYVTVTLCINLLTCLRCVYDACVPLRSCWSPVVCWAAGPARLPLESSALPQCSSVLPLSQTTRPSTASPATTRRAFPPKLSPWRNSGVTCWLQNFCSAAQSSATTSLPGLYDTWRVVQADWVAECRGCCCCWPALIARGCGRRTSLWRHRDLLAARLWTETETGLRFHVSLGNESVPKIIINNTMNLFFKSAINILVVSNHNSFRALFDKIASVYFIWKIYLYFSIGNCQPRKPALCQLYRHTFVTYTLV